jgi:hypothetical protein
MKTITRQAKIKKLFIVQESDADYLDCGELPTKKVKKFLKSSQNEVWITE